MAQAALAGTLVHTSVADFSAGSGACELRGAGGGELALLGTFSEEMDAPPAGWTVYDWTAAGSVAYTGGEARIDGARLDPEPIGSNEFTPPIALEFRARFGNQAFQHVGLGGQPPTGDLFDIAPWVLVSTGTGGSVAVRYSEVGHSGGAAGAPRVTAVCDGNLLAGTPCPCANGTCIGESHTYRMQWNVDDTVDVSVDGVPVHRADPGDVGGSWGGQMRPAASDFSTGTTLRLDWLRMSPYSSPCAYRSVSVDAGAPSTWAVTPTWAAGREPRRGGPHQR